ATGRRCRHILALPADPAADPARRLRAPGTAASAERVDGATPTHDSRQPNSAPERLYLHTYWVDTAPGPAPGTRGEGATVIPSALIRQRREMHRRIRQVVAERRREMAQATADTEVTQEIPPVESTR